MKPWEVMMKLEKFLKLEKFFDEDKFVKREDGYNCVKDETAESGMDCMPSSKGRGGVRFGSQSEIDPRISRGIVSTLTPFYDKISYFCYKERSLFEFIY